MSLTKASLKCIPVSFASVSIGCREEHTLPIKIDAIAKAGYTGIELGFPDLLSFASLHLRHDVRPKDFENLCTAATVVKKLCDAKKLDIILLQPFSNFEGWPKDSVERKDAFERAAGWIQIMISCGCKTLQVGSTDTPDEKIDRNFIVRDLQELADMLAKHDLRLAYENWCWSTHAPDWKDVWSICQDVDRPNFGLCLDTFQTAGGEWGDPTTSSGMLEPHGEDRDAVEKQFHASLEELSRTVPKDRIYLLQISDAYKPKQPFDPAPGQDGLRPRGRWSHDFRPAPFKGYLPIAEVTKAVLRTGFRGWFSYEIFDGGPDGTGKEYDLEDFAIETFASHGKLLEACTDK